MTITELIKALYSKFRNLILYGIIGCCTASLDFLIFTGLTQWISIHYIVANVISCSTGILCSFLLIVSNSFTYSIVPFMQAFTGFFFLKKTMVKFIKPIIFCICNCSIAAGDAFAKIVLLTFDKTT